MLQLYNLKIVLLKAVISPSEISLVSISLTKILFNCYETSLIRHHSFRGGKLFISKIGTTSVPVVVVLVATAMGCPPRGWHLHSPPPA